MRESIGTAYLAPNGYESQLEDELHGITEKHDRLFITQLLPQEVFWAQNIWYKPFLAHFESISEAANLLKSIQRNWKLYPFVEIRRASLIQDKLPYISKKPVLFPTQIPNAPLGSWTLLNKNTLIASAECSSAYANGEIFFEECKEEPPSRAYLKLWEALTIAGKMPSNGSRCLEIGSSPGGWTWVLASLGAEVISVDRSPLAPNVAKMPGVHFKAGNAFSMLPETIGAVDWIFSDVACYPEKLLEWVQIWIKSGLCKNFICTLKFQGEDSYAIAKEFASIPKSRVLHLSQNKHELTWIL